MTDITNTKKLGYSSEEIDAILAKVVPMETSLSSISGKVTTAENTLDSLESTVKNWIEEFLVKEELIPEKIVETEKGKRYTTLAEAINDNTSVKIIKDITIAGETLLSLKLDKEIALNNATISAASKGRAFSIIGTGVQISGEGNINNNNCSDINPNTSVIRLAPDSQEVSLTIGENVVVESDKSYVVTAFGANKATLVVKGTIESKMSELKATASGAFDEQAALSGNGTQSYAETDITIDTNAKVIANKSYAIYLPQAGTLTIKGTVKGYGAIEIKSGTLNIEEGAKIIATAEEIQDGDNTDGCSTRGYAIAAVEHNSYKGNIIVNISGGEIKGKVGKVVDVEYSNGKAKPEFNITGGKFSEDPSDLLSENYEATLDTEGWYVVSHKTVETPTE